MVGFVEGFLIVFDFVYVIVVVDCGFEFFEIEFGVCDGVVQMIVLVLVFGVVEDERGDFVDEFDVLIVLFSFYVE